MPARRMDWRSQGRHGQNGLSMRLSGGIAPGMEVDLALEGMVDASTVLDARREACPVSGPRKELSWFGKMPHSRLYLRSIPGGIIFPDTV